MTRKTAPQLRVLIIDDDDMIRSYLKLMLREAQINVIDEADDAAAAVKKFRAFPPQLILLDINLPDQDGIELLKQIRDEIPESRVVMVSSESTMDRVKTALALGARGFIAKPFNTATVLKNIMQTIADIG